MPAPFRAASPLKRVSLLLLVLLVVEELGVDGDDAALALLLERYFAVDGGEDAVTPQLVGPLPQRIAVDSDQLHEPVLEGVGGEGKVGAERHRRGNNGGLRVDAENLGELLRLLGVQAVLSVERRSDVHGVLAADGLPQVVVREPLGLAGLTNFLERRCSVHAWCLLSACGNEGLSAGRASRHRLLLQVARALDEEVNDVAPEPRVLGLVDDVRPRAWPRQLDLDDLG